MTAAHVSIYSFSGSKMDTSILEANSLWSLIGPSFRGKLRLKVMLSM